MFTLNDLISCLGENYNKKAKELFSLGMNTSSSTQYSRLDNSDKYKLSRFLVGNITGSRYNLEDFIGIKGNLGEITHVESEDNEIKITYEIQKLYVLNDSKTMTHQKELRGNNSNLRIILPEIFYISIFPDTGGFALTRPNHPDYGNKGYYHISYEACLGYWIENFETMLSNSEAIPLEVFLRTVDNFLIHQNTSDVAGNWTNFEDYPLATRYNSSVEFYNFMMKCEGLTSWGSYSKDQVVELIREYVKNELGTIYEDDQQRLEERINIWTQ